METGDLNMHVFNMITGINQSKILISVGMSVKILKGILEILSCVLVKMVNMYEVLPRTQRLHVMKS